jgi:hypothetical protein
MHGENERREAGGAMVNRRLLRWGVFLLALGGVLLLGQAGALDLELVRVALGLWPLALMAVGAAILLRATPAGLAAGVVAAALPGLLLGGLVVSAPDVGAHCRTGSQAGFDTRQGTFATQSDVDLRVACGDLRVTTGPGGNWEARIGQGSRPAPTVSVEPALLRIATAPQRVWFGTSGAGEIIELTLPTEPRLDLGAWVGAGTAELDLAGANLGQTSVIVNAGQANLDLTGATVTRLSVEVNAGGGSIRLPAADFEGSLEVHGGELRVCVPSDLGLHIRSDVSLGEIQHPGFRASRGGSGWDSPGYEQAAHRAELSVDVNVGSVEFNPPGGCQ